MRPYWIMPSGPRSLGVGVTERSEENAVHLFQKAFPGAAIMSIRALEDMRDLDQNHVLPNMGNWHRRGIWFPLGHELLPATEGYV